MRISDWSSDVCSSDLKKVDAGILFVIAKDDRKMRIEVGYGLGGAVPDILAGRIIREQVAPRFREGDFDKGVTAGVDSLAKLVNGESLPPPAVHKRSEEHTSELQSLMRISYAVFCLK